MQAVEGTVIGWKLISTVRSRNASVTKLPGSRDFTWARVGSLRDAERSFTVS
ncbi:hypothetical protein ACIRVK_29810 [Streptomyces sp. NPDC101152]|uniref:hypothetical protein n=1 Tax=Streptomyces sp. NPDC101152 TaxID=3366116 RepID=UPI00381FDE84